MNNNHISAGTIARTAALALALTNQILSAAGKPVIPIDNAQLEQFITTGFTVGASIVNWWYNQSFTQAAIEGDKTYEASRIRFIRTPRLPHNSTSLGIPRTRGLGGSFFIAVFCNIFPGNALKTAFPARLFS
ncbi:MAG: phage holin [Oscillospiraceae bacterium]